MTQKKDVDLEKKLTPEQYRICRECGTEPPFSGSLLNNHEPGTYLCICCGNILFDSEVKYDSGSGWPSFWEKHSLGAIVERKDEKFGMVRREVRCGKCDAHLGHVFEDGPEPTGLRYCINSTALQFVPKSKA
jgi:peptide-methionine (R)-S-oxide reductase